MPPAAPTRQLTVHPAVVDRAESDARLFVGLKNSDDQGTNFDVKVELLQNGAPVASGLSRCVSGVTRNPAASEGRGCDVGTRPIPCPWMQATCCRFESRLE